jgi:hypothetical protein
MNDAAPLGSVYIPGIPTQLERVGQHYRLMSWQVPEGRDWHECLSPHYWAKCLHELTPGGRIEVHDASHQVQFEILILACNPIAVPPTLDLGFRAIYPPDLQLPVSSTKRRHRAVYRNGPNDWSVISPSGETVAVEIADREGALRAAGLLDQVSADAGETERALAAAGAQPKAA